MKKVKLHFTLVGKSESWKRKMPHELLKEATNQDTLTFVRNTVSDRFGNRALVMVDEDKLLLGPYPKFYSAGWFISEGDNASELVVVHHGSTMDLATKSMLNYVCNVDWDNIAATVT